MFIDCNENFYRDDEIEIANHRDKSFTEYIIDKHPCFILKKNLKT